MILSIKELGKVIERDGLPCLIGGADSTAFDLIRDICCDNSVIVSKVILSLSYIIEIRIFVVSNVLR
jgi:hypothetical protein